MAKLSEYLGNIFLIILIIQFLPLMINSIKRYYTSLVEPRSQVAYLPIKGVLSDSSSYIKELKKFFENKDIKALLLKIESPGGAAGSSQAIFNEINALKKEHPKTVIALVENVCASGSYYVACAADHIIAAPSAFIGSIGAYISYPQLNELMENYKVRWNLIKAGKYKTAGSPFVPTTKDVEEMLQSLVNDTYQRFVKDVAEKRPKLSLANADQWAQGRVFTGDQALQLGLIDELGSLATAIQRIKEKEAIEGEIEWVKPPKAGPLARLFGAEDETTESESLATSLTNAVVAKVQEAASTIQL